MEQVRSENYSKAELAVLRDYIVVNANELAEQMELLNDELTNPTDEEKQYIDEKCSAIIEHMAELDALIDEKSTGWKTNRMAQARHSGKHPSAGNGTVTGVRHHTACHL